MVLRHLFRATRLEQQLRLPTVWPSLRLITQLCKEKWMLNRQLLSRLRDRSRFLKQPLKMSNSDWLLSRITPMISPPKSTESKFKLTLFKELSALTKARPRCWKIGWSLSRPQLLRWMIKWLSLSRMLSAPKPQWTAWMFASRLSKESRSTSSSMRVPLLTLIFVETPPAVIAARPTTLLSLTKMSTSALIRPSTCTVTNAMGSLDGPLTSALLALTSTAISLSHWATFSEWTAQMLLAEPSPKQCSSPMLTMVTLVTTKTAFASMAALQTHPARIHGIMLIHSEWTLLIRCAVATCPCEHRKKFDKVRRDIPVGSISLQRKLSGIIGLIALDSFPLTRRSWS